MAIRIVQLGSPRAPGEGLRIGTVRRPPRGVPKAEFGSRDFYDVWFPNLAPTPETLKRGMEATDDAEWRAFVRAYRAEMNVADRQRELDLLAALSHTAEFALGCYCDDESRCHRSILRELLLARGADVK